MKMMRETITALVLTGTSLLASGCEAQAPADAAPVEEKKIGYDLRILRPGEQKLGEQFDGMLKASVQEGKRVAVLFSADWCQPCVRLEAELGNLQPASQIEDVRILIVKEEDWRDVTRMGEFDKLRLRWSPAVGNFPLFVLLDEQGQQLEEMKKAIDRLKADGIEPTVANWFSHPASASGA
jgi:hypothetical protein